jgi:hypothetical protein
MQSSRPTVNGGRRSNRIQPINVPSLVVVPERAAGSPPRTETIRVPSSVAINAYNAFSAAAGAGYPPLGQSDEDIALNVEFLVSRNRALEQQLADYKRSNALFKDEAQRSYAAIITKDKAIKALEKDGAVLSKRAVDQGAVIDSMRETLSCKDREIACMATKLETLKNTLQDERAEHRARDIARDIALETANTTVASLREQRDGTEHLITVLLTSNERMVRQIEGLRNDVPVLPELDQYEQLKTAFRELQAIFTDCITMEPMDNCTLLITGQLMDSASYLRLHANANASGRYYPNCPFTRHLVTCSIRCPVLTRVCEILKENQIDPSAAV